MSRLLNFAMFYLGWFACVAGAGRGQLWLGPAVVAVLLMGHLLLTRDRVREATLALTIGLFGFAVDTLQASAGLYAFSGTSVLPWVCPPWMAALWMLFATTLNSSMGWLGGRYRLAAVLGALFGPVSYLAGARLGAIELSASVLVSLAGIAIVWALAMPALLVIRDTLCRPSRPWRRGSETRSSRVDEFPQPRPAAQEIASSRAGTCLCQGVPASQSRSSVALSSLGAHPALISPPVAPGESTPSPSGNDTCPGCMVSETSTATSTLVRFVVSRA